ncbi:MAG: nitronate monooxygenase, partial [Candidatus Sumerlaeia bacterium]|nr:nitronate monooxygenase [Candidatus Sumerlaeia bacterium]
MKTQLNPCNIQAPLSSKHPVIIQGGMGAAVSHWKLANAVAREGMLGVVSGTGMDHVMARRLQNGDPDGMMRAAIAEFPCPHTAEQALLRYYIPGGKAADKPYKLPPLFRLDSSSDHYAMIALSMFVEVWLAKRGHEGVVGLNLLEKIALPNPALLYGAMLAGVDYVLMGAGIPIQIPGILDQLSRGEAVELRVTVEGDTSTDGVVQRFDPRWVTQENPPALKRPHFIAIVSSAVLAQSLLKRATGSIEGFVVEGHIAGGHNAPPRGPMQLSDRGEPIYGERDGVDLEKFRALGVPFWLAGGQGIPGALASALEQGAAGIQVGTLFAFCTDSGLDPVLRRRALEKAHAGELCIFTDPQASPTGFPFKVVELEGTLSDSTL